MTSELMNALRMVADEKSMAVEALIATIEDAVAIAASKRLNRENLEVHFDQSRGDFELYELLEVVEEPTDKLAHISLDKALLLDPASVIGSVVKNRVHMEDLGRIAAQSVRQMIHKKGREAELHRQFLNYKARVGEMVTARMAKRGEGGIVFDFGEVEAILPQSEQLAQDKYERGKHFRLLIAEVSEGRREPVITLSRTHPGLLRKLMEMEAPELADGSVEIAAIARDATGRSKVVVKTIKKDIDPVGACVGAHGVRIKPVMRELSGEKIDIFAWSEDPKKLISAALIPAKNMKVFPAEKEKRAEVIVPDDQLLAAIGKKGVNVKLAQKVTGWQLDVMSAKEWEEFQARKAGQGAEDRPAREDRKGAKPAGEQSGG
ncbi:MAG: transcription termination/antitermination protein NusA [Nitrospinae bacterium]|nr:transcription termination/antitermination protein NusA [Nitrospinota bacterium]